jgi:hypothetical protein
LDSGGEGAKEASPSSVLEGLKVCVIEEADAIEPESPTRPSQTELLVGAFVDTRSEAVVEEARSPSRRTRQVAPERLQIRGNLEGDREEAHGDEVRVSKVCVTRQHIAKPVLGAREPLGVEGHPMHQEEGGEMPGCLELKGVVVPGKIRFPEPASGGGAAPLSEHAQSRRNMPGKELDPNGHDAAKELKEIQ